MMLWLWWLNIWAFWLRGAADMVRPAPPEPPRGGKVVDLEHWRRTHPHGGRAA